MKPENSNSMNFLAWKYLVIVATLLVAFACAQRCAAQQKAGWTLIFDDEFNENSVTDLFSSTGLWCSFGQCDPRATVSPMTPRSSLESDRMRYADHKHCIDEQ